LPSLGGKSGLPSIGGELPSLGGGEKMRLFEEINIEEDDNAEVIEEKT
jgi:hypothetical protein